MGGEDYGAACSGCGLVIPGGAEGCLALYRQVTEEELGLPAYAGFGRVVWDTYCVQHPDRYCISAKSLAAHLGGLCWALEHGGHPSGYRALDRFLDGPPRFDKPALPPDHGTLTIGDVAAAGAPVGRVRVMDEWARPTWAPYAPPQPLARRWGEAGLAGR